jgi:hypothetical protein
MNQESGQGVAGKVLQDLVAERFEDVEAAVKPEGRSTLNAQNIAEVWGRARQASGDYQGAGEPIVSSVDGGELFDYPLDFERSKAHLQVVVAGGQVAGMLLRPGSPTGEWNK